jgi:signal transduction histidine kinase
MSHETRNSLTAIKTFVQLLPERHEFLEEFRRVVTQEIARLEQIIEAIHAFANPPPPKWERVDPSRLLNDAVEQARQRMQAPDAPSFVGDPRALTEALAHLVVHALENAKPAAKLHVLVAAERIAHPEGDRILLSVHDDGRGIPEEIRPGLFSPFGTTKARGFGLGLPIVRRVVLAHGGEVRIDSSGHGAWVTVLLPVSRPDEPSRASAELSKPSEPPR